MLNNIFFDLDGTLTNPANGIANCINYSLQKLGEETRPKAELIQFIGPPLRWSYANLLTTSNADLIEKAMTLYRERFSETGIYENELYGSVSELVLELHRMSFRLFVVTSKPTVYSKKIVEHFKLDSYFNGVFGPELDGRFDNKTQLIAHLLKEHDLAPTETIMIGDRKEDVIAEKSNGTKTIWVAYGYGTFEELLGCTPDHICNSPAQILPIMRDYQSAHYRC
ncbi:HAD hydrolase-like protein [Chloroflexota bacterium]